MSHALSLEHNSALLVAAFTHATWDLRMEEQEGCEELRDNLGMKKSDE